MLFKPLFPFLFTPPLPTLLDVLMYACTSIRTSFSTSRGRGVCSTRGKLLTSPESKRPKRAKHWGRAKLRLLHVRLSASAPGQEFANIGLALQMWNIHELFFIFSLLSFLLWFHHYYCITIRVYSYYLVSFIRSSRVFVYLLWYLVPKPCASNSAHSFSGSWHLFTRFNQKLIQSF